MICCKIVTDLKNENSSLSSLLEKLTYHGSILIENGSLFFGTDDDININKLKKILKKHGFENSYIEIYDKNNYPKEESHIEGWIVDWLVKLEKKHIESEQQENFKYISQELNKLNQEIDKEIIRIENETEGKDGR